MAKEIFKPFAVADERIMIDSGEWLDDKDQPLIDDGLLSKRWSPNIILELNRNIIFDTKKLMEQTGLEINDKIRVCSSWYSSGTNIRSSLSENFYEDITLVNEVSEIHHSANLSIPGLLISDQITLRNNIILLEKNNKNLKSAELKGSILWEDHETISLEGRSPLFPIETTSFPQSYNNANWFLEISAEDLNSTISGGMRLYINSNKSEYLENFFKDPKYINLIFNYLVKQIIEHCLYDDDFNSIEFIESANYENDSIGNLALQLISKITNQNPRKLYDIVKYKPVEFDRLIQHTFSIGQ